jgi:hypothetical protein
MIPIAKSEKRKGKKQQNGPCSKKSTPKDFRPGCFGVETDLSNIPNIEELDDEVFMQPDDVVAFASSADAVAEAAVRKNPKGKSKKKKEVEILEEGEIDIEDGATTSITPGVEAVLSEYSSEAYLRAEWQKIDEIRKKIATMKAMGYGGRDFPYRKEYFRVKITTELHVVGIPHPGNVEQVGFIRCKQ